MTQFPRGQRWSLRARERARAGQRYCCILATLVQMMNRAQFIERIQGVQLSYSCALLESNTWRIRHKLEKISEEPRMEERGVQ